MKEYPHILPWNKGCFGQPIIAFDKLDGSNIRVEWSRKRVKKDNGFYKFGTRTRLLDKTDEIFGIVPGIFMDKYSENLNKVFKDHKQYRHIESFTMFLEFFGPNSFAGRHVVEDKKDLTLFDICMYKHGFVLPRDFVNNFNGVGIPLVIYDGTYNQSFIDYIRMDSKHELREGVVCKGVSGKEKIWMTKIKTNLWLSRVHEKYGLERVSEELDGDMSLVSFVDIERPNKI